MSPDRSILTVVDRAHAEFDSRLRGVSGATWQQSTPCEEWDVGQLVDHVAGAARIYSALLQGQRFDEAMRAGEPRASNTNRRRHYLDSVAELRDSLADPGAMTRECDVPGGPIAGLGLATVRVFDVTVHGWDLARALRASERLPASIVDYALGYATKHYGEDATAAATNRTGSPADLSPDLELLFLITGRFP